MRTIECNLVADIRSLIDYAVLYHANVAGVERRYYTYHLGAALGDDLELYLNQYLLTAEVIAGHPHSGVTQSLSSVVTDRNRTSVDIRENVSEIFHVIIPCGCDHEL